jgi:hypothetical protein
MSQPIARGKLPCIFTRGHQFPPVPQSADNEAPHWTCKRCGRKSFTEPQDLWAGLWLKARDGGPRRW